MAKKKSQVEKFREAAREADADDSQERFDATLKGLAKSPRTAKDKDQSGRRRRQKLVAVHRQT
ncbi:hypothetical protein CVM73_18645 [Bradyrhizobium forestalis]|uniref:Uncharacterized protein n=1 Tax=Bradyrhizobium forestalis TaxID=1419263 RepID=A0A2M8R7H5_9BRAD|nr:hypothetical protein CVM73_18645 [Bradyrhizobium forestalis]